MKRQYFFVDMTPGSLFHDSRVTRVQDKNGRWRPATLPAANRAAAAASKITGRMIGIRVKVVPGQEGVKP